MKKHIHYLAILVLLSHYSYSKTIIEFEEYPLCDANNTEQLFFDNITVFAISPNEIACSLYTAIYENNYDTVVRLVNCGAELGELDEEGNTLLHTAILHSRDIRIIALFAHRDLGLIDKKNYEGKTPLAEAILSFRTEEVRYLIENGADLELIDEDGDTYLHMAAIAEKNSIRNNQDDASILELLLKKIPIFLDTENLDGKTPLGIAEEHDNRAAVKIMLSSSLFGKRRKITADDADTQKKIPKVREKSP